MGGSGGLVRKPCFECCVCLRAEQEESVIEGEVIGICTSVTETLSTACDRLGRQATVKRSSLCIFSPEPNEKVKLIYPQEVAELLSLINIYSIWYPLFKNSDTTRANTAIKKKSTSKPNIKFPGKAQSALFLV